MMKTLIFPPIVIAGCTILMLSFANRFIFGVFQIQVANESGWPGTDFSMVIATQNLH